MKKKIITTSLLGFMAFTTIPASATGGIANSVLGTSAIDSCSTCHSGSSGNESKGNLKAGINAAYQKDKFGFSALKALVAASPTPFVPVCTNGDVLNATQTACVANPVTIVTPDPTITPEPVTPAKTNTNPVLNAVAQQWDAKVGELLTIPLSVSDTEQDDFIIIGNKPADASFSDIHPDLAGLPSVDFEWTPTANQVNKIVTVTFQAKETQTAKHLLSNKVTVKIRVWAAENQNTTSITKLNVMKSKFTAGSLNIAGNVKFNNLLTPAERQAFIGQTFDLTINDLTGESLYSVPLMLDKKGNWAVSIPMTSAPCDITLELAGQNASRKVVGCTNTIINKVVLNDNLNGKHEDNDRESNENEHKNDRGKHD